MPKSFKEQVLAVVRAIPLGEVLTYGDVARRAGTPGAARAVGTLMKTNFDTSVPCHRVIKAQGSIGEYNRGGTAKKKELLLQEGVCIRENKVIINQHNQ
jgi:methylated-DNA-[protein]-cysteine S-methyltransferase